MKVTFEEVIATANKDLIDRYLKEDAIKDVNEIIENNNLDRMKLFLDNGFDVNSYINTNDSLLTAAIRNESNIVEMIKLLLERGANINQATKRGFTPIRLACELIKNPYSSEIINLLIEKDVDLNLNPEKMMSALMVTIYRLKEEEHIELVKLLISKGADINYIDRDGDNVFFSIRNIDNEELSKKVCQILLDNNITIRDKDIDRVKPHIKQMLLDHKDKNKIHLYYGMVTSNKLTFTFPGIVEKEKDNKYFYVFHLGCLPDLVQLPDNDQIVIIKKLAEDRSTIGSDGDMPRIGLHQL